MKLAVANNLDYPGMQADDFWVAEEGGQIVGIVGLKRHPECLELCALGVDEGRRGRGWGSRLVWAILRKEPRAIYLATVIPGFFARFGFEKAEAVPSSMVKTAEWCAGCRPECCLVMMRKAQK